MASRLADHLSAARRRRFVGRETERALFQAALNTEKWPFFILHVFGPGGVGKTTLLQEFAALCQTHQITPLSLDARHLDPSPNSFTLALQLALGSETSLSPLDALAAQSQRSVIFIDTYEKLNPLDGWLREVFLPQLPENVLLVMAGREALAAGWRIDPGLNPFIRTMPLRNLNPEESRTYLNQREVSAEQHQSVLDFTRGHPLALSLIADVLDQREDQQFVPGEAPDVIQTLLERFVQKVPSPAHRTALEACALFHLTTEALLAEILQVANSRELFDWLRSLSFIQYGKEGLFPHDLVRDVLCADLQWRNPDWYAELHHRARVYYMKRLQQTRSDEQRRVLVEYIYLHRRNPVVRPAFEWQEGGNVWSDTARAGDVLELLTMLARHEGEASAKLAAYWFERNLNSVQVFRGDKQKPTGFLMTLILESVTEDIRRHDPALEKAWKFLQRQAPLRAGERFIYFRYWLAGETYQAASPTQSGIFISMVQYYFATPGLAFTFLPCANPEIWAPVAAYADLVRLTETDFEVGGRRYGIYGHDWRAVPPMAWLELLAARELSQRFDYSVAPKTRATVVLSEPDFAEAIHEALRAYSRPNALRKSPLLQSRLVIAQSDGMADESERIAVLLELIHQAAKSLETSPRDAKLYQVLYRTYFNPAESQEIAADTLHLAFSTYRRYLKAGIERVTEILWLKEISG
ncbi:MAG: hypothetical protein ALAOOOJD_00012 [bacterium]|nr:hypothetical protein [bacterium]